MKLLSYSIILVPLLLLSACSSSNDSSNKSQHVSSNKGNQSANTELLIHQNVTTLANKLFSNAKNIKLSQSVAVGTFLPIHLKSSPDLAEQHYVGLQIQESFITLAAQAGLNVVEYKTAAAIKVTPGADVMLSRDTQELTATVEAQYFLTGTYSEHDNKLIVNARIIELSEKKVIAAATGYIPMPSLNDRQNITIKNKMLYRETL
jgi:TolB-like protein